MPSPTPAAIAALIRDVLAAEKPSGQWKPGEVAVAANGTTLSSSPQDPAYFVDGHNFTVRYHRDLLEANSATEPTPAGLTWRDFSRARGYSRAEIEQYARLLDLLADAGLDFPSWARLAGYDCAFAMFDADGGVDLAASVLSRELHRTT